MAKKKVETRWEAQAEVAYMRAMRAHLEGLVGDDEEVIRDTIEGATEVDATMEALIRLRNEAEALALARKELAKTYADAAKANLAQAAKIKKLILECLKAAGQERWTGVAGATFIAEGSWSTEIVNASHVPLEYQKAVPNVERIKEELTSLRLELEAMGDADLRKAAYAEGVERGEVRSIIQMSPEARAALIAEALALRVPGARIVKGEDHLTILKPRGLKEAAE
jgi:hypothetical protein